jgi:hypothetical protein
VLIVIVAVLARNRLGDRLGRVIVDYVTSFSFSLFKFNLTTTSFPTFLPLLIPLLLLSSSSLLFLEYLRC